MCVHFCVCVRLCRHVGLALNDKNDLFVQMGLEKLLLTDVVLEVSFFKTLMTCMLVALSVKMSMYN